MAAGRQRVDTQLGGEGAGRAGVRISRPFPLMFIGSWSICKAGAFAKQDEYCLPLGMKYYGRALPCACLHSIHLISKHMTNLRNCVLQANRNLMQHRPGIKTTPPLTPMKL